MLRHRESHAESLYAVAFNQVDASLASTFATVGANRVTVYSIQPGSEAPPQKAGGGGSNASSSGKRGREEVNTACSLVTLQAYCDEDEGECFYCCAWGLQLQDAELSSSAATPSDGSGENVNCGEAPGDVSHASSDVRSVLAVGGTRGHIKVIDCCDGCVRAWLQGHCGAINELRFHPMHRALLLSCSADESCRLWHVGSRECLATFGGDGGHRDAVVSLDVRLDGSSFASCSIDGTVKVWPLETPAILQRIEASKCTNGGVGEPKGAGAGIMPAHAMPPAVVQIPTATYDRVHYEPASQLSYWIDCVRCIGDRRLLTRGSDGRAMLWEPSDVSEEVHGDSAVTHASRQAGKYANVKDAPNVLREFRIKDTAGIWYLRFHLDLPRRRMAIGNTCGEVLVWDLDGNMATSSASKIASVAPVASLKVGEPAVGKKAKQSKTAAQQNAITIRSTALSHDGRYVVSGCDDGSIVIWDLGA